MSKPQATERQQFWLSHIEACQQQGISMKDYAQQTGITLRALYDAKHRLIKAGLLPRQKPSRFQKVEIKPTVSGFCIIVLSNGARLEWPTNGSTQSLAAMLSVLEQCR